MIDSEDKRPEPESLLAIAKKGGAARDIAVFLFIAKSEQPIPKVSVHRHAGVKIITNHHDIKQDHSLDCEIYSRSNHLYFEFTPTCLWTLSLSSIWMVLFSRE